MNPYVTGTIIRATREAQHLTQAELAERLMVTDKAISKWETGKSYPDITLLEPLAAALNVSVTELLSGQNVANQNRHFNILRSQIYVCPVCGNVLFSTGEAVISCCGITLMPLEAEPIDDNHVFHIEQIEDELYISSNHEMSKTHSLSFLAAVYDDSILLKKLYPEGSAEAYFPKRRLKILYACCNRHGLFFFKPTFSAKNQF